MSQPPTHQSVEVTRDIVYARRETGSLLLDLYLPSTSTVSLPVVLWLHGGGWFTGDRTLAPDLASHALATGAAMASIEYRLSGEALFPAQLHDVRAAIRYLRTHSADWGLDPERIGLWGASAGGHLAALAGLTGNLATVPREEPVEGSAAVHAVAASYPPVDLAGIIDSSVSPGAGRGWDQSPEGRLLGSDPSHVPELARQANPLSWVGDQAPPFQLSHGTSDVLVPHQHSERLHAALQEAGCTSELYLVEGYKHGFLNPPGRLDVQMAAVMDDGRLAAEGAAVASYRTTADPGASIETTFGFSDIEEFFRRHLGLNHSAGENT